MALVKSYCIKEGYRHREHTQYFNDTAMTDEWQREVYLVAKHLVDKYSYESILDIGCGSGFKLMKHFSDKRTIGIDLPQTVTFLRRKYPDRDWRESNFSRPWSHEEPVDLVIASDIIEHLADPDELMTYLAATRTKLVVISTPERDMLANGQDGPPANPAHVREWNFPEFRRYVETSFDVVMHGISNAQQAAQYAVLRPRK